MATIDETMNEDINDHRGMSARQQDRQYHALVTQHNFLLQENARLANRTLYLEDVARHYKQFVEKIAHSQLSFIPSHLCNDAIDYIANEPTQI